MAVNGTVDGLPDSPVRQESGVACGLLSPKDKKQGQLICQERRIMGGVTTFFP